MLCYFLAYMVLALRPRESRLRRLVILAHSRTRSVTVAGH